MAKVDHLWQPYSTWSEGPSMAKMIAVDGLEGPLTVGDQLRYDSTGVSDEMLVCEC